MRNTNLLNNNFGARRRHFHNIYITFMRNMTILSLISKTYSLNRFEIYTALGSFGVTRFVPLDHFLCGSIVKPYPTRVS